MVAARRCHLVEVIWPALDAGTWVVCDRFADSTMAYQGNGGGVAAENLTALHRLIAGDFMPDLTFMLDVPVEIGLARAGRRQDAETRFERKDRAFHDRVRQAFLDIAHREPGRCEVVDASGGVDAVSAAMRAAIRRRFALQVEP